MASASGVEITHCVYLSQIEELSNDDIKSWWNEVVDEIYEVIFFSIHSIQETFSELENLS